MDLIIIRELAVSYRVGVTEEERATPQRLLLDLEISHDCAPAAARDDLTRTIDYQAVCQRLLRFGDGHSWKLIETLAVDIATSSGVNSKLCLPPSKCASSSFRRRDTSPSGSADLNGH